MIVIDFETEKVKEFNKLDFCMFINDMIKAKDTDLLNRRYLFLPDKKSTTFVLENLLEKAEKNLQN